MDLQSLANRSSLIKRGLPGFGLIWESFIYAGGF
jgi:hypothetical protein